MLKIKKIQFNMTLIELIVVLSILVAVVSVAMVSMDSMDNTSRYQECIRRGNLLQTSVEGIDPGKNGRFISDMGRVPYVINPLSAALLAEVFYSSDDLNAYDSSMLYGQKTYSNSDNDWGGVGGAGTFNFPSSLKPLKLSCGWRGPYMNVSRNVFYDGWGNDWNVRCSNDNTWTGAMTWENSPGVGKGIFGIKTLGKNNQIDSGNVDWFNEDLSFDFEKNNAVCDLNIQIFYKDTSVNPAVFLPLDESFMNFIRVAIFAPYITNDSNSNDNVKRILAMYDNGTFDIAITPAEDSDYPHTEDDIPPYWTGVHSVLLKNLSPGIRKIYVYGFKDNSSSSNKFGSKILSVNLNSGLNVVNVYLTEAL
jgi:hypothetical protein